MQEGQSTQDTRIPIQTNGHATVYEVGVKELHHVTNDDLVNKRVESEFREARGRETARLHVTLKAVSEADRRNAENAKLTMVGIERVSAELREKTEHLNQLVESFENVAGKQFASVHEDIRNRAEALKAQVEGLTRVEAAHFEAIKEQMATFQRGAWNQADANHNNLHSQAQANFDAVTTQARENTERITFDVRQTRDELVSLVDTRMNQADASFAALRGDIEVVKFLVMDLIKDRIGRHDPKNKPF